MRWIAALKLVFVSFQFSQSAFAKDLPCSSFFASPVTMTASVLQQIDFMDLTEQQVARMVIESKHPSVESKPPCVGPECEEETPWMLVYHRKKIGREIFKTEYLITLREPFDPHDQSAHITSIHETTDVMGQALKGVSNEFYGQVADKKGLAAEYVHFKGLEVQVEPSSQAKLLQKHSVTIEDLKYRLNTWPIAEVFVSPRSRKGTYLLAHPNGNGKILRIVLLNRRDGVIQLLTAYETVARSRQAERQNTKPHGELTGDEIAIGQAAAF